MRQGLLPIRVEVVPTGDEVTARGGHVVLHETLLALGLPELVKEHLHVARRWSKNSDFNKLCDLVHLMAGGGDCFDDIKMLAADQGLCRLLGRKPASAETLRQFLYAFHDQTLVDHARDEADKNDRRAYIVPDSQHLLSLAQINTALVAKIAKHLNQSTATLDHDATILESHKREARAHYKGGRGYQPAAIYWAEGDLVLADEFRDGNVPAGMENLALIKRGFLALPKNIGVLRFRADSACYEEAVLKWLVNMLREGGPKGRIEFTISADMTEPLRKLCEAVVEAAWQHLEDRATETVWCSEVDFTPGDWPKDASPLRYVVVRIRKQQGELFSSGSDTKYLAVVSNRDLAAVDVLKWHWEKAGTIELVHDVMKNELAAAVPPCGRFGANAAWFRISALTYNLLSAMKSLGLNAEHGTARPKRLRALVLTLPGRIVSHAGQLILRVGERAEELAGLISARRKLLQLATAATPP